MVLLYGGRVEKTFEHAIQGSLLTITEAQAKVLAQDSRVSYVDQDREIPLSATYQAPPVQWGLNRVDERDFPLNNHFTYTTTGAGVNAYILDTGISADDFMDFGSRVVNAFTAIQDASGNPLFGDCNGHGTKVAKALGGSISGVAKGVTLNAVRIATICNCSPGQGDGGFDPPLFSTGSCQGILLSDALDGINWVTAHRVKPAVANMSFGGSANQSLDDGVQAMINAGVVAVASAGNAGVDACGLSPARIPGVLTVGASDQNDARSVWNSTQSSNYGSCLDLFAPGTNLDLWNTTAFSGTSAAAPLVAGAVARYLQSTPSATPSQAHSYIINNATVSHLTNIGSGSPNRLLFSPPGGPEVDDPPVANFTFSCTGRACSFTSTSTDDFVLASCGWDFGYPYDPFNPPLNNVCVLSHTFPAAGSYSVTLYVRDDLYQTGQKTKLVTVN
ncbi:MAG TPA: S8 family serine peptidase [Thermoanaerobaculia bacterium]|jgi:subtilisin family serine protease|nr:S8 family serine peptidase [Thermoanaerobaculia bacterium]